MDDSFAAVVARLYAAPPEDFVALRTEEVARARKARDTRLAAAIAKLRKPTVAAWLVNLVAHERPDLVEELLELAEELRTAQRELRGAELRELSTRRRATVGALAREAAKLAGPGRGNLPLTEVENTFAAALADPEVAAAVREGSLTKALEYTGFGETPRPQLRLVHGTGDSAAAASATVRQIRSAPSDDERERRAEARRREEERRQAEEEHARAVRQARRELMTALQQLSDAETAKSEAEKQVAAAEKAIALAEKRVALAQAALSDLGPAAT
ncbi:TolC family protein [Dactylosporangium roseum]|uniref:TolC family protein n=1 Tax=Dactylosporangium roseum TaxID=47989 RepID=A0ABY5Z7F0_9ACTN|nr:TolC family protein [Dactylosporangium roseum]UWZ37579.1 TolC family protein [Dactylosporangium roseum]